MFCPSCATRVAPRSGSCTHCGMALPASFWDSLSAPSAAGITDTEPSQVGALLEDRYRVESFLARGGMGLVFQGADLKLKRKVAIKFLAEELRSQPAVVQRFVREAQSMASLDHPNIVHV